MNESDKFRAVGYSALGMQMASDLNKFANMTPEEQEEHLRKQEEKRQINAKLQKEKEDQERSSLQTFFLLMFAFLPIIGMLFWAISEWLKSSV
jgi:hypothetical protein